MHTYQHQTTTPLALSQQDRLQDAGPADGPVVGDVVGALRMQAQHRIRRDPVGVAHLGPVEAVDAVEGGVASQLVKLGDDAVQVLQENVAHGVPCNGSERWG